MYENCLMGLEASTVNLHFEIIERCRHGDEAAQYELYRLYSKAMFNTALRICGAREEAEDVLQESFLSAFKHIASYRAEASFGAWLKRIVVNKALSALKKNAKEALMLEEVADEYDDMDYHDSPATTIDVDRVRMAVMDLPTGFRSVLSLYLFEGYDHKEISGILGISESTSKTQYKRAKDKLRSLLEKEVSHG